MNTEPETSNTTYIVFIDDNYHYRDEAYRYKLGDFPTCEAASAACKSVIDGFLLDARKPGMTAEALYKLYQGFGEDPFIVSDDRSCKLSAWTYAESRCRDLCPS